MSSWVSRKFDWLRVVAADPTLRGLPLAVAVELVNYFNPHKDGEAWPAVETLADNLGVTRRGVQLALDKLVEGKMLGRQRGGGGPRDTSRYWMLEGFKGEVEFALKRKKGERQSTKRVNAGVKKGRTGVHPSPVSESARIPRESRFATDSLSDPDSVSARKTRKRTTHNLRSSRKTEFPEGWQLSDAELAVGSMIAGWDLPQAEEEFGKFRDWNLDKGYLSANWPAAWQTWCRRGRDYEERQDASRETGMRSVMMGLEEGLERMKRTKH